MKKNRMTCLNVNNNTHENIFQYYDKNKKLNNIFYT